MAETPAVPFEPRRFRTSAEYYLRGRLPYPDELIARVISVSGLTPGDTVLDLGCGPGLLAVNFAPHAREVIGLDPEPAMLEAAVAHARDEGVKVTFQLGSSYDLDKLTDTFQLVTMGRSFHWMDRPATLESLDRLVAPGGAVVLFKDTHPDLPQNEWWTHFRAVIDPYASRDPAHPRTGQSGPRIPHEAFLLESKFSRLERFSVIKRIETPVERLLDRALSMSTTSPERLGDEVETVLEKLRRVLSEDASDGIITEIVESEALLAFREPER
jgi:ubiquinone/menaquinone biosynthesis C-methylase UbiE